MAKQPSESQAIKAVNWLPDHAINGVRPLTSAEDLAQEYLIDTSYCDHEDRVDALINWETSKNFTSGFITGLGGVITLPVMIPAAFGASWLIQARMAGAIARIYGHNLTSDRVRTFVLVSLLGDSAKEVLRQAGIRVATKLTQNVLKRIPGKALIEINKRVGFRLLTKAGEKGVVNFAKGVPLIGGFVGGTFDALACRTVGRTAFNLFKRDMK